MPWGGRMAAGGGALWAALHVWWLTAGNATNSDFFLDGLSVVAIAFAPGLVALFQRLDRIGRVGALLALAGLSGFVIGTLGSYAWPRLFRIATPGEAAVCAGLGLLGLASLRRPALSRWNALPIVMALAYFPSWGLDPTDVPAVLPGHTLDLLGAAYGVGWVLLGILIQKESRKES